MPKKIKTTAEQAGIIPVSDVVKCIEKKLAEFAPPPKKERAKKILTPEEAAKRKAILTERLVKARAAKVAKKSAI